MPAVVGSESRHLIGIRSSGMIAKLLLARGK
jgi:hypothetical protein